ncbi:hypothetical protein GWC95_11450 [Sediminibacterium roseum]|uniref:Holin-X, holin superfamily III n=1 Tax=Sediminibacterium roseum TaxID=1978412 RepID=A0ABW9ZW00_9BACT|nr:hypothetical protein [Sediminibacterium roseum]NCI50542.1 hypothetical protein [Sediminibacterium roseum]
MEKTFDKLNAEKEDNPNIAELAADYAETYYKLTVVNINQKIADISAGASFSMVAAMIVCFVFMFIGIAGALWLGKLVNDQALGFLLFGGFCIVVLIFLFVTRKKIFFPLIKNMVIKSIYE